MRFCDGLPGKGFHLVYADEPAIRRSDLDQKRPGVTGLTNDQDPQSVCRVLHDPPDDDEWLLREYRRIGRCIRDARVDHNLTQERVFLAVPLTRSYYQEIEAGQANPTLETLLRIARVIGVPIADLLK